MPGSASTGNGRNLPAYQGTTMNKKDNFDPNSVALKRDSSIEHRCQKCRCTLLHRAECVKAKRLDLLQQPAD